MLFDVTVFYVILIQFQVPSAEYEPPKGSQEYNFDKFQEVTTEELESDPNVYKPKIIQPGFSSFFDTSELRKNEKFQNPPGLTFKTVTTALPKFTYSVITTPVPSYETTTEGIRLFLFSFGSVKLRRFFLVFVGGLKYPDKIEF